MDKGTSLLLSLLSLILLDSSASEHEATTLHLQANYYHVRFTSEQLQEQSQYPVLTLTLSRPLIEEEHIIEANLLGENSNFYLSSSTLNVHLIGQPSPGRHNMDIVIIVEVQGSHGIILSAPLTVDIFAAAGESCHLQPFGKCSQFCVEDSNSIIGYTCFCEVGYNLQLDGFTCLVNDPIPVLLYSDSDGIHAFSKIYQHLPFLIANYSTVINLFDYSYNNQVLYYATQNQVIMSMPFTSGEKESFELFELADGVVGAVVYDWINEAVVITDMESGEIIKIFTSNASTEVMFTLLKKPRNLVIQGHAEEQQLAWIEGETNSTLIKVVNLTSGEISVLVENLMEEPLDIDIDTVTGALYWITVNGKLQSFSTSIETIYECDGLMPTSLAIFEVYAYIVIQRSIIRINVLKPQERLHYHQTGLSMTDVCIYHPSKQPNNREEVSNCSECEQLCIISASRLQCECSAGYVLSQDGFSCYPSNAFQLILTLSVEVNNLQRGTMISASLDGTQQSQIVDSSFGKDQTPVTGLIYALALDVHQQFIYFCDRNTSTLWLVPINRISDLQDNRERIANNIHAWGMSYDWIHKTLYWTDDRNMSVGKLMLNGVQSSDVETIYSGAQSPRGISVDPFNEWLYWIEAGDTPAISRLMLSGRFYQMLFNSELRQPSGLSINFLTNTLYWGDTNTIGQMDLKTNKRQTFDIGSEIAPFQLTTIGQYVVFTINESTKYGVINVEADLLTTVALHSDNPRSLMHGIITLSQSTQPSKAQYLCYFKNCSHFCNINENETASCGCPAAHLLLKDQTTCSYEGVCPACRNEGICNVHGRDISCSCTAGFTGDDCNQNCTSNTFGMNCQQMCECVNGTCNSLDGSCRCFPHFSGKLCNKPICFPECRNDGICIAPDKCLCQETYDGPSCERRKCTPDYCFNGGTCFVDFGIDLSCRCPTTASGPQCQFDNNIEFNLLSKSELGTAIGIPLIFAVMFVTLAIALILVMKHYKVIENLKLMKQQ